jgi:hypothetical protein
MFEMRSHSRPGGGHRTRRPPSVLIQCCFTVEKARECEAPRRTKRKPRPTCAGKDTGLCRDESREVRRASAPKLPDKNATKKRRDKRMQHLRRKAELKERRANEARKAEFREFKAKKRRAAIGIRPPFPGAKNACDRPGSR